MRFVLSLLLLLVSLPALAQTPTASDAIISQESAFWTAYTAGNATELEKLLLPDFTSVEQEIWDRDKVLSFVKFFFSKCSLAPVKINDPHVSFLTPDIATVVYHAVETPTCGTRTMSGETNISTVWVHRDGRWQMKLHTEYAVPAKQ